MAARVAPQLRMRTRALRRRVSEEEMEQLLEQEILRIGAGAFGSFSQSYELPEGVSGENIKGSYTGGVLRVTVVRFTLAVWRRGADLLWPVCVVFAATTRGGC